MADLYCTIVEGGYGAPHRYYNDHEAAVRAALRHCKRTGESMSVVWCKHHGNPKLWLAHVTPRGWTKTDSWEACFGEEALAEYAMRVALLAARRRLADTTTSQISTVAHAGKTDIVRTTFVGRRTVVTPMQTGLTDAEAIDFLNTLGVEITQ